MDFNYWNVDLANKTFQIKYMNYFVALPQFGVEFSLTRQYPEFSIKIKQLYK